MNTRIFLLTFTLIFGGGLFAFYFFEGRVAEQAKKMLAFTTVAVSPDHQFVVGFFEDCTGTVTETRTNNCVRNVFIHDTKNKSRQTCDMFSGSMQNTPVFKDMKIEWTGDHSLVWTSNWNASPNVLNLDRTSCLDYSSFWDRFELIPTIKDSLTRFKDQKVEAAREVNRRIMDDALRQIQTQ